jgi:hypothetical protein
VFYKARQPMERKKILERSTAILAVGLAGILLAGRKAHNQARTPGCPTGKMPVLQEICDKLAA